MTHIYPRAFMGDKIVDFNSAHLSIASSAVLYGLSIYTVFPLTQNKDGQLIAFRVEDHFKRLQDSAKIVGLDTFLNEWDLESFINCVRELVTANKVEKSAFIRATVHVDELVAGTRSRGLHTILSLFMYEAPPVIPQSGARLKTSVWRRVPDYAIPSRAKINGAYVNSVLAKQDALDSGYDDCIFLDAQGHVCELSTANIFIVRNGELLTPAATNDLLEGINRSTIIQLATDLGTPVKERSIDLSELYIADEIFACGTSAFMAEITEIDARIIRSGGPISTKLQKLHAEVLSGDNESYRHWATLVG